MSLAFVFSPLLFKHVSACACPIQVGLFCRSDTKGALASFTEVLESKTFLFVEPGNEVSYPFARIAIIVCCVKASAGDFAGVLVHQGGGWTGYAWTGIVQEP